MTREQAKEYLSAVRPHSVDAADPILQPAIELAKKDSELGSWFARQREFDEILIEKVSSIRPPEGLREKILQSIEETARPIQFWRISWLALAAAVVLAVLLLSHQVELFRSPSQRFRSFYSDALAMVPVKPAPKLDLETASLGTTQAFITQHDAPRLGQFPRNLEAMAYRRLPCFCLAKTSCLSYLFPPSIRRSFASSRNRNLAVPCHFALPRWQPSASAWPSWPMLIAIQPRWGSPGS